MNDEAQPVAHVRPLNAPASLEGGGVAEVDETSAVTIDGLLTMVNIALGTAAVSDCLAGDGNQDGAITVAGSEVSRKDVRGEIFRDAAPTANTGANFNRGG